MSFAGDRWRDLAGSGGEQLYAKGWGGTDAAAPIEARHRSRTSPSPVVVSAVQCAVASRPTVKWPWTTLSWRMADPSPRSIVGARWRGDGRSGSPGGRTSRSACHPKRQSARRTADRWPRARAGRSHPQIARAARDRRRLV